MKKNLYIALGIAVITMLAIVGGFFSFKKDPMKENEIIEQAQWYIEERLSTRFQIVGTLFDEMEKFPFDYAIQVVHPDTDLIFLVYYDEETQQMVDTYVTVKWIDELKQEMAPSITAHFGENVVYHAYLDDKLGVQLGISSLNPGSYKHFTIKPTIQLTLPRQKQADDAQLLQDFTAQLIEGNILKHGKLAIEYTAKNGDILEDDSWYRTF